jgi:heme/copper-type cytochrome/quinol oxidase subunit 3
MVIFRLVFGLLLFGSIGCFVAYVFTQERRWLRRGVRVLAATVIIGLLFFVGMMIERLL